VTVRIVQCSQLRYLVQVSDSLGTNKRVLLAAKGAANLFFLDSNASFSFSQHPKIVVIEIWRIVLTGIDRGSVVLSRDGGLSSILVCWNCQN
jgi:hypothetical protein